MPSKVNSGGRGPRSMALVLTTTASRSQANRLIEDALRLRLAACAITWPVDSRYWWKGRRERAREFAVLFKTTRTGVRSLMDRLSKKHPYEVPEIAQVDVRRVSPPYLKWLETETTTPRAHRRVRNTSKPRRRE